MRKLFATIALCIILIGTFAPVSVSVSQVFNRNTTDTTIITQSDSRFISVQRAFATSGTNPTTQVDTECGDADFFCMLFKFFLTFFLFVPNTIATLSGLLMDVSLKVSISPAMYGVGTDTIAESIRTAWKIIRDLTNIAFIFALFVSAFSLIAGRDFLGDPKKTVVKVIIMALLVNFSLLFCRIIIQSADVFSNLLYNRIAIDSGKNSDGSDNSSFSVDNLIGSANIKSASLALISKVNPQSILLAGEKNYNTTKWFGLVKSKTWDFYIEYGVVALIVFFIYFILIAMFLGMLFIFLGRIIGLWLGMILSPIAFVSYTIPFLADNQYVGFESWLKNFVKLSFTTPLFLFFLYLAITVLKLGTIVPEEIRSSSGIIANLITILLPLFAATFILMYGKKIATNMAGIVGEMAGKVSGMVTGLALGAATGGTGMLARQTFGRAGAAIANSDMLRKASSRDGFGSGFATTLRYGGKQLSASSFDVRNNAFTMNKFKQATGAMGGEIDLGAKFMNKGGYVQEGGIRENVRNTFNNLGSGISEKRKKMNEELRLNDQAEAEKKVRADADKLTKAQAQKTNEDKRQDQAIYQFDISEAFIKSEDTRLDDEGKALAEVSDKLARIIDSKDEEVTSYEEKLNKKDPKDVTQEEVWELERKKNDLENLKKEKGLVDRAVLRKDSAKDTNREVVDMLATSGFGSVADINKKVQFLEAGKEKSPQAEAVKKAQEKHDEEKKKANEIAKDLKDLKSRGIVLGNPEYDDLIAKQTRQNTEVLTKFNELQNAKSTLDTNFTAEIKRLKGIEKSLSDKYKGSDYQKTLKELALHRQESASQSFEDSEFRRNHANNSVAQTYAQTLEARGRNGGLTRGVVGVITGGRLGGENISNAGINTANDIRRNLGR